MGLGYCSKVVSTVYGSPDLPSCRRHQKAPLGASRGNLGKESRRHASQGHFELGGPSKFCGHAQHTAAPYGAGAPRICVASPYSVLRVSCTVSQLPGEQVGSDWIKGLHRHM